LATNVSPQDRGRNRRSLLPYLGSQTTTELREKFQDAMVSEQKIAAVDWAT